MPVNTPNAEYSKMQDVWVKCRHAIEGEKAVKDAGLLYLPVLGGQDSGDYSAYKMRATWYGAPARTKTALSGALMMRQPTIQYPEARKKDLKTVGSRAESIYEVMKVACDEVLEVGRVGHLVDSHAGGTPYIAKYCTERIIGWEEHVIGDRTVLTEVRLLETEEVPAEDDPWIKKTETSVRVLRLREMSESARMYTQQVYKMKVRDHVDSNGARSVVVEWEPGEEFAPKQVGGRTLSEIPFLFTNVSGSSAEPQSPPLEALIDVAFSHYRNSADLEHGLHFTALPTPWTAGFETKSQLVIGSSRAWMSDNPEAKAGFLEFTGAGLAAIESRMRDKRNQMAVLGARMLDDARRDPESGAALAVRASGERSSLSNIAITMGENFTTLLKWVLGWTQPDATENDKVSVQVNKEYGFAPMDANMVTALLTVYQSGAMSYESFYAAMQKGGIAGEDITAEAEAVRIQAGGPMPLGPKPPLGGADDDDTTTESDPDNE